MIYMKRPVTPEILDTLRINLSAHVLKLSPEPSCDFCGSPHGAWQYAAERMSTGQEIPCWRWLACADCSSLVDSNSWDKVEDRACDAVRRLLGVVAPEAQLRYGVRRSLDAFHRDAVREETTEGIARSTAYRVLFN